MVLEFTDFPIRIWAHMISEKRRDARWINRLEAWIHAFESVRTRLHAEDDVPSGVVGEGHHRACIPSKAAEAERLLELNAVTLSVMEDVHGTGPEAQNPPDLAIKLFGHSESHRAY